MTMRFLPLRGRSRGDRTFGALEFYGLFLMGRLDIA
jgi:hypothetical protein